MDGAKEGTGELSTAWGRGGPQNTPAAAPGGGQVAPQVEADLHAGGLQSAPAGCASPSPAGLVGKQTSDKPGLQSLTFTAHNHSAATAQLAQSARLRRMKLVVGHHADTVRELFKTSGVACHCVMVT
jgi:hypothetical protein